MSENIRLIAKLISKAKDVATNTVANLASLLTVSSLATVRA